MNTLNLSPEVEAILRDAIATLCDIQSNSGCNDYWIPRTEEMRGLWKEYNQWNCQGCNGPEHDQWMPLQESSDNQWAVNDGFQIYLLKKHLGLLKK